MAEQAFYTDEAWTATFTSGSAAVTLGGVNAVLEGWLPGDMIVDGGGVPRAIIAVAAGELTLAANAPTSYAAIQCRIMPTSRQRTSLAANSEITREVYAKLYAALSDNRSIPVKSLVSAPPGAPVNGDRHLIIATATGVFATLEGYIAQRESSLSLGWLFIPPVKGMQLTVDDSSTVKVYTGSEWSDIGLGDVVGPASATDNAIARFDATTGKLLQNSGAILEDTGSVLFPGYVRSGGAAVGYVAMFPGDAGRSGYLGFFNAAGTRQGYIGDVAGGVISLYAEAGNAWSISGAMTVSGNISGAGTIAAPGLIGITGAAGVNGYATLKHGDAAATGYLEFQHKDGTRRGYIGYASGGYINMVAEGGYGWNVASRLTLSGGESSQLEIAGATKTWRVSVATGTGEIYFHNSTDSSFPITIDAAATTHTLRVLSTSVTVGATAVEGHHVLSKGAADATHRMHVSGGATGWSAGLNRPGDSAGTTLTWASYASATWTTRMSLTTSLLTLTTPLSIGTSAARVNPASGYSITNYGQGNSFWLFGANTNFISGIHFGDPADDDVGKIEYAHNGDYMAFWTNAAERMRLLSGGDLLIGRTTASGYSARLDIQCPTGGYGYVITDATYATNVLRFSLSYGVEMGNIGGSPLHFLTTNIQRITILADGKVGISTVNPAAVFDVNGDVAHRMAALTVANGANHNVSRPAFSSLRISAPTAAFQITGLTGGADGIEAELINTTSHQMTLDNESASSTAGNRIVTDTGGNLNCKHAILRYDATSTRWRVVSYRT